MNRNDWLKRAKEILGDVNIAVEVGVWRGDYSRFINEHLVPQQFYGVDPYMQYNDYPDGEDFADQVSLDRLHAATLLRYNSWGATLLRSTSVDAASQFLDGTLDFVYLDGDHVYEGVKADIAAWWPKIRPGGILSGHDYCNVDPKKNFGVILAVNELVSEHKLTLGVTSELYPNWWVVK